MQRLQNSWSVPLQSMQRTFIAFHVEPDPRLSRVIDQLDQIGPPVRVPSQSGLHLTVQFLGDTTDAQIPELSAMLDSIATDNATIRTSFVGLGVFPDRRRPAVVWAGLEQERLSHVQFLVSEQTEMMGWVSEARAWRPHVTLARVNPRRRVPAELDDLLDRHVTSDFGEHRLHRIVLFESQRTSRGVRYHELHSVLLPEAPS